MSELQHCARCGEAKQISKMKADPSAAIYADSVGLMVCADGCRSAGKGKP